MRIVITVSILSLFFSTLLFAEAPRITSYMTMHELQEFSDSDGALGDNLGKSVAMSGDTAIVGAPSDDCANSDTNCGSAIIFERNPATGLFEQLAKLTASDGTENDNFGKSVAISGDTVIVGAYWDAAAGTYSGSAYIFEKPASGGWVDATETAKLIASDGGVNHYFGISVGISGDTVIVGAYGSNSTGSAYIFEKHATEGWPSAVETKLTASDGAASDWFGWSVAISGDTAIVGASAAETPGLLNSGIAYIFEKHATEGWISATETILIAFSQRTFAAFGESVAISGNTAIVGQPGMNCFDGDYCGAAYIFENSGSGWVVRDRLVSSGRGKASSNFGKSVAISGDRVIVGAYTYGYTGSISGSAFVFEKPASGWGSSIITQNIKLSASNGMTSDFFGGSVAISGDTVIVGAYGKDGSAVETGSAYVFVDALTQNSIENKNEILDIQASDAEGNPITFSIAGGSDAAHFNINAASGALSFNAAPDFESPADTDTDNIYEMLLELSDSSESDTFRVFVKVSDVEYEGQIPKAISFKELNKLTSLVPSADQKFGRSVAVSGSTAIVGAYAYNMLTGTAYIYEYQSSSNTFVQQAQLSALNGGTFERFGFSVAISGDTVIVGTPDDNAGTAYLFEKPALGGWVDATETAKLTASDAVANDSLGYSVAIRGDTVIVGAYMDDDGGTASGSAYIFEKPASGWIDATQSAKLTASNGLGNDFFGYSVAISGDTAIVGAYGDDDNGDFSGLAYIFEKPVTGWIDATQSAKLTAPDGLAYDYFGRSVAISGDTVIVGASGDNCAAGDYCGSAYIFEKPASGWIDVTQSSKLTASDSADEDNFGSSVAISSNTVVVGASMDDCADSSIDCGSAYLFEKPASGWITATESAKLTASDGLEEDEFGGSVAISGNTVIVGIDYHSDSAYIFKGKSSQGVNPAIIMLLID